MLEQITEEDLELDKEEDKHNMKASCSYEFINYCNIKYPLLQNAINYRKLFWYICFNVRLHFNGSSTNLMVDYKLLCKMNDQDPEAMNFSAINFLKSFKRDVLPNMQWSDYTFSGSGNGWVGKSRELIEKGLDCQDLEMIQSELSNKLDANGKRYFFDTEELYNHNSRSIRRKKIKLEYEEKSKNFNLNASQQLIYDTLQQPSMSGISYLNKLNENEQLIKNAIDNLLPKIDDKIEIEEKRLNQYRILESIREEPRIFYKPVHRSARLYTEGDSVINLSRDVRKAFCKGWYEADLVSSQFIILTAFMQRALGNSKRLMASDFIKSKKNLWKYLLNEMKVEDPDGRIKSIIKVMMYSICFGMGKKKLKEECISNGVEGFLDIPMIAEMIKARSLILDNIYKKGGEQDVWGVFHKIGPGGKYTDLEGNDAEEKSIHRGSVLARCIQNIELEIISGAFEYLKTETHAQVVLFQHDGLTLSIKEGREAGIISNLENSIIEKSLQVGRDMIMDLTDMKLEVKKL